MKTPKQPRDEHGKDELELVVEDIADLEPSSDVAGGIAGGSGTVTQPRRRIEAQNC